MNAFHLIARRMLFLVLLVLPMREARSFVDPPTFSPEQPYAGQPAVMSVRHGVCHIFVVPPPEIPALEVQVDGDIIDVIIAGIEAYPPLCVNPVVTATRNIGEFPEGVYTVRIRIRETEPPYSILPPISQAGLIVRGTPSSVPVGRVAMMVLIIIVAGVAMLRFRKTGLLQGL